MRSPLMISFLVVATLAISPVSLAGSARKPAAEDTKATVLKNRLYEIKSLDKSQLPGTEKKALRKEVREIRKELAAIGGGVYLSAGAILLIALLLILLL